MGNFFKRSKPQLGSGGHFFQRGRWSWVVSRARKKLRIRRKSSMRASWDFTTFVNLNKTITNRRTQCSQSLLRSLINRWLQVVPSWQLQLAIIPILLGVGDGDRASSERCCAPHATERTLPHHTLWTRQMYTPGPSVRLPEAASPLSLSGNSSNDTDMMSPLSSSPVSHSIQIFTTGSS